MASELPKTYEPTAMEAEAYRVWLSEGAFHADPAAPGKPYTIVIPPPNVTGALHLGHAINNTTQDILIRQHRMAGFNTLWMPGLDHAGIATQAIVEKQLKENEGKTRHDVGREALVARIWEWKEQYGNRILEQLKRLGASCDWERTRFTLDDQCARAVRHTFFKLFKDGLIYRGKRLVNWDVFLQTSVSDDEIYHETVDTSLWHIRYPIDDTDKFMVVATTRPETMLGDTAVAVHSGDARWNWAIGKNVRLPLTDRLVPIIADDILVDPKFGSGVVKVTPAHDPNDYAVWQRHRDQADRIGIINILTPDGQINNAGAPYTGLQRHVARKKVIEDLITLGLLEKEEPYQTQVGHSDRSKTPIEPYLSDQWFIHMAPLAEPALDAVRDGRVKFTPDRYARTYLDWLGEKRDWPISRQLWWGHRIPVWMRFTSGRELKATPRLKKWEELDRLDPRVSLKWMPHGEAMGQYMAICLREPSPELEKKLESDGFTQEEDVLDTWFSSALWPHSTLGWPDETPELKRYYPTTVLVTSRDIITLWVARMVMTGLYNLWEVPFRDVYIHPTILDGKGERMSKSKGNGVDPVDIIDTHGADALRFTLTGMATETQDVRLPVKKDAKGRNTSDKFDLGRNFCNKLWNAARFALANLEKTPFEPVDEKQWGLMDRWICSRLMRAIDDANAALETYRFDTYARVCYDFFWRDLCDWYVEAAKPQMKGPRAGQVANVLAACLDGALRLMHPMIPFITETIWWKLNEVRPDRSLGTLWSLPPGERLIKAAWPIVSPELAHEGIEFIFNHLREIVEAIRKLRNDHKVDPKTPVLVSIQATGDAARQISDNQAVVELLAGCTIRQIAPTLSRESSSARLSVGDCELFVEGLIDESAERDRQSRRREELVKQIAAMEGRLSNKAYTAKAPAKLVEETRDQLAAAQNELAKLVN